MAEKQAPALKIIVVGDMRVGKTKLSERFATGKFTEDYYPTIGVTFVTGYVKIKKADVKLVVWDTCGQEEFSRLRPLYYRGAFGALVCFDTTNLKSFKNLNSWLEEVNTNCGYIPTALISTKMDLKKEKKVTKRRINPYLRKTKLPFMETSAKDGINVKEAFTLLSEKIFEKL